MCHEGCKQIAGPAGPYATKLIYPYAIQGPESKIFVSLPASQADAHGLC